MPIERTKRFRPLFPGDDCTVVFPDTTPDLICTFQGYWGTPDQLVVTTPQGEKNPDLQVVHYLDNYNYINHDVVSGVGTIDGINEQGYVGEDVEVFFANNGNNLLSITGTITAVQGTTLELDNNKVVKDYFYLEVI